MTKISKLIAAASSVAVLGIAALPVAGFAAGDTFTTDLNVIIGDVCSLGEGGDDAGGGTPGDGIGNSLTVDLSTGNMFGEATTGSPAGAANIWSGKEIAVSCNAAGPGGTGNYSAATLSQSMTGSGYLTSASSPDVFVPITNTVDSGAAGAGNFTLGANKGVYGMRYAGGSGGLLTTTNLNVTLWHNPAATPNVASWSAPLVGVNIAQTFGAKTDGTMKAATYSNSILYTLVAGTIQP